MRFTDRFIGLDPEKAQHGNPDYDTYRKGVFTVKASGAILAAGVAFDLFGLTVPAAIATLAGVGGISVGGTQMALNTGKLSPENIHEAHRN